MTTTDVAAPVVLADGKVTLHAADCRDVLRGLDDNSIDSVVTDPPYALVSIQKRFAKSPRSETTENPTNPYGRTGRGFMGKTWDNGEVAFAVEFWAEVLRVLKPGGHVVAFSGTRTYHRMAVAIEDAGFEIRDQLGWLYGSGFPKSHAVDAGLWKGVLNCQSKENAPLVVQLSAFTHLKSREAREHIVAAPALILPEGAPALIMAIGREGGLSGVTVMSLSESEAESISLSTGWSWEKSLVDRSEPRSMYTTEMNEKQITTTKIWKSLTSLITQKSTLRNVTLQNGWTWPAITVASSSKGENTSRNAIPILTVLDDATWNPVAQASGAGTSLKPAWEPICLARKPLDGTVAANVLKWGVGALNIDGCRVGDEVRVNAPSSTKERVAMGGGWREDAQPTVATGRWPANIVHDGSDEVVGAFPDAKGQQGYVGPEHGERPSRGIYGDFGARPANPPRVESDKSAARFFYCAKASRADRDEGLEALRKAKPEELTGRKGGSAGLVMEDGKANPFAGTTGQVPRANIHPTVKPTELMRWLARLVTPPGGTILDPFMGSGSTGKAAVWEGFRFIGCEREDEYIPIAEARIRYAIENPPGAAKKKKPANDNTPPAQAGGATTDLFGGAV